jgi:RNA polymerase sigma-70 factor (ECF subfamily)
MNATRLLVAAALLTSIYNAVSADELTIETAPPVVVKTVPEAGVKDVDPEVKEIKVTFSKDMADKSWSWSTAWENSTPQASGAPKYQTDKRTCVLSVKLEPGKVYGFWLNSENFQNFKDAKGRPAVPYLLIFRTKDAEHKAPEHTSLRSDRADRRLPQEGSLSKPSQSRALPPTSSDGF